VPISLATTRFWKPHGDIRYVWLNCCERILPLNPLTFSKKEKSFYPSKVVHHLDCKNESKTRLKHHILIPNPSAPSQEKFRSEIEGSKKEIEKAAAGGAKLILIAGFAGWDYEELVGPIIQSIGKIPIYYITRHNYESEEQAGHEVPQLWSALKGVKNAVVTGDGAKTLYKILKENGYREKYKQLFEKYEGLIDETL
jgi:hypothetical protein